MKNSWKKNVSVWSITAAVAVTSCPIGSMLAVNVYGQDTGVLESVLPKSEVREDTIAGTTEEALTELKAAEIQAAESQVMEAPETELQTVQAPETELQTAQAPETEGAGTEPQATEAPETEPQATEVPETEPQITEAPETEPQITEVPETEPAATEPQITETPETEEETAEEETTEAQTTEETEEETTEEEPTEPVTEEDEWSEEPVVEDTRGLTFSYDDNSEGYVVSGFDASRTVVEIPETYGGIKIVGIASYAFQNQTGITAIVIPEGVTSIGREAFAGCTSLGDIRIPSTVENIGAKAFDGTPWDAALTGDLVYINRILYRCQTDAAAVTIADGTRVIAEEAFAGRKNLLSIVIPEGVTYISARAFADCSSLQEIQVAESVADIVANAFDGTPWYESRKSDFIYINKLLYRAPENMPETAEDAAYEAVIADGTTTICTLAFAGTRVGRVVMPEGLSAIKYGAFQNCEKLTEVIFPESLVSIDGGAFQNCAVLAKLVLPAGLNAIGSSAFAGCTVLENFAFPADLKSIGSSAFSDCTGLTAVVLPNGLEKAGSRIFERCINLRQAETNLVSAEMFKDCTALTQVTVREGSYVIGSGAFENCVGLSWVQLSSTVSTIGSWAFAGCRLLSSIVLPESVKVIGGRAFSECTALGAITIPDGTEMLGEGAFYGCSSISAIRIPENIAAVRNTTFQNCTSLSQVIISDGIKYIGEAAFAGCASLRETAIPESVLTICAGAFEGAGLSGELMLPGKLRTVGNRAFANCVGLTETSIPASVRTMGEQVFYGCSGLSIQCEFTHTGYFDRLASGWASDWADGTAGISFLIQVPSESQKQVLLMQICRMVPDFEPGAIFDDVFYTELFGRVWANGGCGSEDVDENWARVSELSVKKAVYNFLGVWPEFYPVNGEGVSVYYEAGYYYIQKQAYKADESGYLLDWNRESESYHLYRYNVETGIADGNIFITLAESDNDNGLKAIYKYAEGIGDASYYNVYESEEVRNLSSQIGGKWVSEDGTEYYLDKDSRIVYIGSAENMVFYRYTLEPYEQEESYIMNFADLQTGERLLAWNVLADEAFTRMEFFNMENAESEMVLTLMESK